MAATATDSNATVEYKTVLNVALDDANGTEDGHQVTLAVGATQFLVVVTAEDGTTTQTYTVHVTRAVPLPTLSIGTGSATESSPFIQFCGDAVGGGLGERDGDLYGIVRERRHGGRGGSLDHHVDGNDQRRLDVGAMPDHPGVRTPSTRRTRPSR